MISRKQFWNVSITLRNSRKYWHKIEACCSYRIVLIKKKACSWHLTKGLHYDMYWQKDMPIDVLYVCVIEPRSCVCQHLQWVKYQYFGLRIGDAIPEISKTLLMADAIYSLDIFYVLLFSARLFWLKDKDYWHVKCVRLLAKINTIRLMYT